MMSTKKTKIGILTFHWATNYGAVLQAYALSNVLLNLGYEVKIINYKPSKFDFSVYKFFRSREFFRLKSFIFQFRKENELGRFRSNNLDLTDRYFSLKQLVENPPEFDFYISGSDQIFNPSFVRAGDKYPAITYFLPFVSSTKKRISYAVSFGCTVYPADLKKVIKMPLSKFDFISCREETGVDICNELGCKANLVPDPTLLLSKNDYIHLLDHTIHSNESREHVPYLYSYILHGRKRINSFLNKKFCDDFKVHFYSSSVLSLEEWISTVYFSKYVVTNSFHGLMLALIFNKPFAVVLEKIENSQMNDRFFTILKKLGLLDRIISEKNITSLKDVIMLPIDWAVVNDKISDYRKEGFNFLTSSLK
ncbi:MAG: polysaccharide pyruvyl transferase family protein [Bacteroidetes bacterium]|nr:polysaccharide pyruvyl transferase family protein [Bacteroidota bacterium]